MVSHDYHHSIPDQVFEDIDLSQLTSIKENSLAEVIQSLEQGQMDMFLNPDVTRY